MILRLKAQNKLMVNHNGIMHLNNVGTYSETKILAMILVEPNSVVPASRFFP